jgi:hypothetical protein
MDNKYLFEIPDSILGSEMMTITRYSKTVEESLVGEEVNRQVVRWEKGVTTFCSSQLPMLSCHR